MAAGDDYKQHLELQHDIREYDKILSLTLAAKQADSDEEDKEEEEDVSDKSFIDIFNTKLKDIRDIAEGKTDIMNMENDDQECAGEEQIWNMFETIKKNVMDLDLSKVTLENSIVDSLDDVEEKDGGLRWFEGSYYVCNKCNKREFGDNAFRLHLRKIHNLPPKETRQLTSFYSRYERRSYPCQICGARLDHDYSSLSQHFKRKHDNMSIVEYADTFVTDEAEASLNTLEESIADPIPNTAHKPMLKILSPTLINEMFHERGTSPPTINTESVSEGSHQDARITPNISVEEKQPTKFVTLKPRKRRLSASTTSSRLSAKTTTPSTAPPPPAAPQPPGAGVEVTRVVEAAADQAEVLAVKREPVEARRVRTLYYCPYKVGGGDTAPPCQFFTNKAGFMNNKAADHLMNVHKLRLQDMKPGQCKFNKVKVEKE